MELTPSAGAAQRLGARGARAKRGLLLRARPTGWTAAPGRKRQSCQQQPGIPLSRRSHVHLPPWGENGRSSHLVPMRLRSRPSGCQLQQPPLHPSAAALSSPPTACRRLCSAALLCAPCSLVPSSVLRTAGSTAPDSRWQPLGRLLRAGAGLLSS